MSRSNRASFAHERVYTRKSNFPRGSVYFFEKLSKIIVTADAHCADLAAHYLRVPRAAGEWREVGLRADCAAVVCGVSHVGDRQPAAHVL